MTLNEKSAYLRGLAEGMKLDTDKAEGRLISELLCALDIAATELEELRDRCSTLQDYVEELDYDLGDIEEIIYDLEDDEDDCFDCDCCSDCDEDEESDKDMRCAMCPSCGDTICFEDELDPSDIICPSCNTPLSAAEKE